MKFFALAAAALVCIAMPAAAQQAEAVPAMDCGTAPNVPSARMMEERTIKARFDRDLKQYSDCVKKYAAERQKAAVDYQAQAKAHLDAGNKAVNDYNALIKSMKESQ
jgi:hypothetical protein